MRLIKAFLSMVRLPNLFFIVLTQCLFHFCIIVPLLKHDNVAPAIDGTNFILILLSSVLIAAAGYIINDYFDINIDHVNKPAKNVVDQVVSRRWAMLWHAIISIAGIVCSFVVSYKTGLWYIVIANFFCVFFLFTYSVSLKRKLLVGNILISLLTSWVILILCFSEMSFFGEYFANRNRIVRIGLLYAGFAFIISLVREAIKDIEDMPGDQKYGCKTMPIVWGLNAAKIYVAVWLIVLLATIAALQIYVLQFRWWWPAVIYCFVLIILPLLYVFYKLFRATEPVHFHHLSNITKLIMLTGILSMVFFYFYL